MHLVSTTDKITVTASASGTIHVHSSYTDYDPSQPTDSEVVPDRKNTVISNTTETDVTPAPGSSGIFRKQKFLNIRNAHASVTADVTIKHTDGTTAVEIDKITLAPGERWTYGSESDV